jgi:hypothetical protein
MENSFSVKQAIRQLYFSSKFMQEYEELGHMNQINKDASSTEERYYLPHHAAFKSSSYTTLTGVAFDGICCSSKGQPLKDTSCRSYNTKRLVFHFLTV